MLRVKSGLAVLLALACVVDPADAVPAPGCKTPTKRCHVIVTVGADPCSNIIATPSKVAVLPSQRNRIYRIIWILPAGYIFKPSKGDGVAIKETFDDQDEFDNAVVSDDEDNGEPSGKANGRHWRWRFVNSKDGLYEYTIRFRHKASSTVCVLDPVITNLDAG